MGVTFVRKVYTDAVGVSRAAAERIVLLAQQRALDAGRCAIALSGGKTPAATYALLAAEPLAQQMPWAKTKIYFGDERHVPHDHPDSNYRMVSEALLTKTTLPSENVFPVPTDHEDVAVCAEWYEDLLRLHFQRSSDVLPHLDLVLLGIGPDGHIASLFAGTSAAAERKRWVTWCDASSADPTITAAVKRITVTAPVIWGAADVFVLATGAAKAAAVAMVTQDAEPADPPVARMLRQCQGVVTFFLDKAAAGAS